MKKIIALAVASVFVSGFAMADTAKPAAPATAVKAAAPAAHPQAACLAEINAELKGFKTSFDNGVKSGKIDATEKAALEKTHADLLALEAKANADKNISAAECKGIHTKIVAEHGALQKALASPAKAAPAPAAAVKAVAPAVKK